MTSNGVDYTLPVFVIGSMLILFVLPSLLAIFDKQVMGIKVKKEEEKDPFDD